MSTSVSDMANSASGNSFAPFSWPYLLLKTHSVCYRNNDYHRQSIVASLVRGVKIHERDRKKNRQGQNALGPPWWEFFNFQLIEELVDPDDKSFFGCIYKLKTPYHSYNHRTQNYPKYVVAFRGTDIKAGIRSQDLKLDLQIIFNSLQNTSRVQLGLKAVDNIVRKAGAGSIWLAGHSLGAAIALLVGRIMSNRGSRLETYLFNPPFTSLPYDKIFKNEKLRNGARMATSIVTAGLAAALKRHKLKRQQDEEFRALSAWVPCLFVNPSDLICSEYIGYFAHRDGEKMMTIAGGKIRRLAAQNSIASVLWTTIGKECDAFHLLPSAHLIINLSPCQDFKDAHGIHQWLRQDIHLEDKLYQFT